MITKPIFMEGFLYGLELKRFNVREQYNFCLEIRDPLFTIYLRW